MKPTQEQIENAKAILEQANICVIYWGVEDVKGRAKELNILLSEEQVAKVLKDMERTHDCNYGVTWETIDFHVGEIGLEISEIDNLNYMFNVLPKYNISITTCENEFEGEPNDECDTYQLSYENEEDYFGEFVYDKVSNELTFNLY
jgi:hypothetical protein